MNVLLLEDETLAAERLVKMLTEIDPTAEVVGVLKSVEATLQWFEKNEEPDLILSDIQLLDSTAFDVFAQRKVSCPVIFTTAFDQYAIQAFEVNSIDYLLKPVQKEKLQASLKKLKDLKGNYQGINETDLTKIASLLKKGANEYKARFMVKIGHRILTIPVEKISYFFSKDKMTYIVVPEGQKYPIDQSLDELETLLDPEVYFRANRKYIIRIEAIKEIHPYFKGRLKLELTPSNEDDVVVSSERTPSFKAWLDR